ncbi:hypothetical protein IFM89_011637 [Coptis chinensis]|uniref:Sulfotransferase n=1 Tax=Coptis chinensis TaxID=261450 RepID=A0A835IW70_9MAGN|nr:hypothetical protein IFM89_011637 [Coptis chinensis]
MLAAQSHFQAHTDDVILASSMKTGATWLKPLIPCIMHSNPDDSCDPLIKNHPNALMPSWRSSSTEGIHHLISQNLLPFDFFELICLYSELPESIEKTDYKIVYITPNTKDTFVSMRHFINSVWAPKRGSFSLEEAFDSFCNGVHAFGPFFEHVLEYWNASLN